MTTDVHQSETTEPFRRLPQDLPPGESPAGDRSGHATMADQVEAEDASGAEVISSDEQLIQTARTIYRASTDYMDSNITTVWETNLAHFNSEHKPSSKFRAQSFKRSKVFRPKTRSMTKSSEAALTNAMFSTLDVLDVQAEDPSDQRQVASAAVGKEMLQLRLDRKIPWYQTVIGAYQSTQVYGLCISFQRWDYHVDTDVVPAQSESGGYIVDEEGNLMGYEQEKVRKDDLCIDLIAPENFRFDPMCDWRDPCGTSPYLIYMMPIYVIDALEKMEQDDPKTGQPAWRKHAMGDLLATRKQWYDRTRQAREGNRRIDPADDPASSSYTTLWAHMNIVKINGDDMMYWTMGTELVLTDPVLLTEAFPHLREGERPFTIGFSTIEAFRNYPAGDVEQAAGLQEEINLVANQRLDNVKLVLNKRYYVKRGSQVDLDALIRNVPGGGVMMNDPEKDVQTVDTRDVTGSSYQEQDRLGVEMDELTGSFSQSSVQNTGNRKGGETKGGMEQMSSGAGAVRDYGLKIFFETWVEPTLRQMMRCEQMYETDITIMTLASKRAQLLQRFGIDELTDELLLNELTVRVNVGMGNTDPQKRVEKLMFATESSAKLPGMAARMKSSDVADEIYGALGYKNAVRFFRTDEEQKQYIEANPPKEDPEMAIKKEEIKMHTQDNERRHQREVMKLEMTAELGFAKLALEKGLKMGDMYQRLGVEKMKNRTLRQTSAADKVIQLKEHALRRETGAGV